MTAKYCRDVHWLQILQHIAKALAFISGIRMQTVGNKIRIVVGDLLCPYSSCVEAFLLFT